MNRIALAIAAAAVLLAPLARAQDKIKITHSGRLLDSEDAPVSGSRTIVVSIFERDTPPVSGSETAAWTKSYDLTLKDGLYSVVLGEDDSLDASHFAGPRFLEISVGGQKLSPRLPIASVPYAARANDAAALGGVAASAYAKAADLYTKAEVDTAFAKKSELDALAEELSGVVGGSFYTKAESDARFAAIDHNHDAAYAAKGDTYTKTEVDAALAPLAKSDDVYTKTAADAAFAAKGNTYTKAEVDAAFAPKDGALPPGAMVISPDPADQKIASAGFSQVGAARSESYIQRTNTGKFLDLVQNAVFYDGKVYVIGGYGATTSTGTPACLGDNNEYDLVTTQWNARQPLPGPRYGLNVGSFEGKIYAIGGYCNNTGGGTNGGQVRTDIYNIETNSWTSGAAPPNTSYGAASVMLADGTFHIISGADYGSGTSATYTKEHRVYDVASNSWTTKAPFPHSVGLINTASGVLPDGRIIVVGGSTGSAATNAAYTYNPKTNTWTTIASFPRSMYGMAGAVIAGQFHAWGGYDVPNTAYRNEHRIYDPVTNTWRSGTAYALTARYLIAAELPGSALIIGGNNGSTYYNQMWEYLAPLYLYSKQ